MKFLISAKKKILRSAEAEKLKRKEKIEKLAILESGLFDAAFYVEQYPDVAALAADGLDPLSHYLRHGGAEGRNPSAEFDGQFYLRTNADVRGAKLNALLHYIKHGKQEGRLIRSVRVSARAPLPKAPKQSEWQDLRSLMARQRESPSVDIIIPVFRGLNETANCLFTVLQSRLTASIQCEVIIIDDASPDRELSDLLQSLAAQGLFTLVRNETNRGFVASVNRGMELHPERDVVLLNSDTEVFGDWVERLRSTAYSDINIGTVTPFSNNATICSYPYFAGEFHGAFDVPFEEIDALARQSNAGAAVDIPTAVGFCMFIRRECLDENGLFDRVFGLGYGEENDFSRRIAARGWRNVLAGDVFVRHLGRVSFLQSADGLGRDALRIIERRYPGYLSEITAYIKEDPPRRLRRNLDLARIHRSNYRRSFLFVLQNTIGGTGRHVRDLTRRLADLDIGVLTLQPNAEGGSICQLDCPGVDHISVTNTIDTKHGLSEAVALLQDLDVVHIHVHHLMGFGLEAPEFIQALAKGCRIRYDFTVHDYLPVCPRVHMINEKKVYCGNSDPDTCEDCLTVNGSPFGEVSAWLWRAMYHRFLEGARRVFVPNEDVAERLGMFLPGMDFAVQPHPQESNSVAQPVIRASGETLRVAVIGATGPHKGSHQLLQCAEDALHRRLPLQFVLVGYSDLAALAKLNNVTVTGEYVDGDLQKILARCRCHISFFPSVCPETYSYTLSEAFFAGLYPVAFDLGAVAHRIRSSGWGYVLPLDMMMLPAKVNETLLSLIPPRVPDTWCPVPGSVLYKDILRDYYALTLCGDSGHPSHTSPLSAEDRV